MSSLQRGDSLRVTLPLSRHESPDRYNGALPDNNPSYYYGWTNDELARLEIDSVTGVMTLRSPIISDSNISGDDYSYGWADDRSVMIGDAVHYLHSDQVISRAW